MSAVGERPPSQFGQDPPLKRPVAFREAPNASTSVLQAATAFVADFWGLGWSCYANGARRVWDVDIVVLLRCKADDAKSGEGCFQDPRRSRSTHSLRASSAFTRSALMRSARTPT
jgi:hypothetical protein